MTFFNSSVPLLYKKQIDFDKESFPDFLYIHWQIGNNLILSTFYTRIDQACLLWGIISAAIFVTAQFAPISWSLQALFWSLLSIIGTVGMVMLTRLWVKVERLGFVLWSWVVLMLAGVIITDLSIFYGWGEILLHLCDLWLALNAIGYFITSFGMRSRTFMLVGIVHLLGILILPYSGSWQFLTTGIIIGGSSVLLAELQWDSVASCTAHKGEADLSPSAQPQLSQSLG